MMQEMNVAKREAELQIESCETQKENLIQQLIGVQAKVSSSVLPLSERLMSLHYALEMGLRKLPCKQ